LDPLALAIFITVYILIVSQRWTGLPVWTSMMAGAVGMVFLGVLTPKEAVEAVDFNVIVFLFGMFSIVAAMEASGLLEYLALRMLARVRTYEQALGVALFGGAVLSAFLVNDTIALLWTPLLIRLARRAGADPIPLLIGLAFGVTLGSVPTPIGNPQNLLVALSSGMSRPFITFASYLIIPTAASLLVTFYILKTYFARGKGTPWLPFVDRDPWYAITDPRLARLSILALSFVVIGALLMEVLHLLGIASSMTIAEVALGGGVLVHLLSSRRRELLARVDWSVLVFFAGMFVVMRGAWEGVFRDILSLPYFSPHSLGGIFLASLGFSQLLSNVPFVALYSYNLRSQGVDGGTKEWLALASGSTVAGNLTILAAASNVIIQEAAESRGAKAFTFWEFLRVGVPVSAASALIYYTYLALV
jgi:Na+/H+ antiporter NhaD/arsenite permease-like protein